MGGRGNEARWWWCALAEQWWTMLSNGGQSVDGGRRGKTECASGGKVSSELDTDIVSGSG